MNVGIFTETFHPHINGVVTFLEKTNRMLQKTNKIAVFTPYCGPLEKQPYDVFTFPSFPLPLYSEYRVAPFTGRAVSIAAGLDLDIVHSHTQFFLGAAAMRVSKKLRLPIVGSFQTMVPEYLSYYMPAAGNFIRPFLWQYIARYLNNCDVVVTQSLVTKNVLEKMGVEKDIRILRGVVDTGVFKPAKKRASPHKTILHVGRISKERNLLMLVKAADIICNKHEDVRFVIAGGGPLLKRLRSIAHPRVTFTGRVPDDVLVDLMQQCDFFVTPSTTDTLGLVVGEAMACGKAAIGPDMGGVTELIKDGGNGLVFAHDDMSDLVSDIEYGLSHPSDMDRMGRNAVKSVKELGPERVSKKLENMYHELA